jgi:hypothetical protein
MIDEVIRLGIINLRDACFVHAFMQWLFHILLLRLLIVAWPNRDRIISALHLIFVAMSQDRLIDAVSLSTVCEPDVLDGKDCFELGLQILGALRDASSGRLRDTIQQLFCSRQITRLSAPFSSRRVYDQRSFFWHLPVSGSSTWIECLNSCFRIIQLNAESPQTQQNFIRSFPKPFFLSFGRQVWTNNHIVKDCSRITFSIMLDMAPYPFLTKIDTFINWTSAFMTRQSR